MHWRDFSLPGKIIALIITAILVGLTYYVTQYLIQGEVTLSSSNDKVWAFHHKDATPYTLPHTFRLRPGRYIFTFGAVGYSDHQERLTIYPFLRRQKTVTLIPATSQSINAAQPSVLDKLLPYSDDQHFDVDFGRQSGTYEITLHENETWFDSKEAYRKALKNDKEIALDWLKAQGVEVQNLSIEWLPFNPDG